jgi:uncharacterized protein YegL
MKKTQATTKPLKTHVIFILDESGSMCGTATDVRGGFNTYIETLKHDGNEYVLSAIKFETKVTPLFANLPLEQVPSLTEKNYTPGGSTALYDAIGFALAEVKIVGNDRFIVIIMTDGFENASKEFTKEMIIGKIERREKRGNWTFVYMGADQDAWAVASSLGFAQGNVLSYASADTGTVMHNLASSTTSASSGTTRSVKTFFTGEEGQ